METPIYHMLRTLRTTARFSMPGHKGSLALNGAWDITELPGADNLYVPEGCIAQSQTLCAREMHAAHAFYSVNGSTACNLAAFLYFSPGDKVIVARDFHVSVENALLLSGVRAAFVAMEQAVGRVPQAVRAQGVIDAMDAHGDARAVFVTSPNYYGMCADLPALARAAHARGMLLVVDAAHGAHFPYSDALPIDAGTAGADIWAVSAHKTLPALNQSAILLASARVDGARLKRCLNRVQTTSPSYPILASLDCARAEMAAHGTRRLQKLLEDLRAVRARLVQAGYAISATDDPTRLVIDVSLRGLTGFAAAQALEACGIYVEGADARHLLLITTICDTPAQLALLADALAKLPAANLCVPATTAYELSAGACAPTGEGRNVPFAQAAGRRAAQSVFCYPPGVPVVLAGQTVSAAQAEALASMCESGYNLLGYTHGCMLCE